MNLTREQFNCDDGYYFAETDIMDFMVFDEYFSCPIYLDEEDAWEEFLEDVSFYASSYDEMLDAIVDNLKQKDDYKIFEKYDREQLKEKLGKPCLIFSVNSLKLTWGDHEIEELGDHIIACYPKTDLYDFDEFGIEG